ncbi:hypothetical protein AMS68_004691 [Peltaster fructicola]|uniref:Sodium/calcium exchanger membrane region domain-containing protein n=1 Tax=Peltaster fructicola TaxID=286661 RepID=A0A6H0XWS4_9PEZI|nr:hypothetical protein AMS68_004691 [Peltaster fructicola]
MHSIRSAARKQAWYHNNDPNARTYNFFGRPNPRARRRVDPETGLTQIQTDASNTTEPDIPGPRKSYTSPSPTSGPSEQRNRGILGTSGLDDVDEKDDHKFMGKEGLSTKSNTSSEPHDATAVDVQNGNSRRRGLLAKLPFGKKKHEQDDNKDLKRSKSKRSNYDEKRTMSSQLRAIFMSWINLLLIFVPVGLAFEYAHLSGPATFVVNFIAIIPLASMLSFATEELAFYVGETFGGLLNATFGNATELIVSIIALTQGKIVIVQTSLIGSILSNLLLVMGMCFFFGGMKRLEQFFNITVAQTAASLLALAIGALVTPTAFRIFSPDDNGVTPLSRATAVLLLFTYICYLVFQLRTHTEMYNRPSEKVDSTRNVFKSKKIDADVAKGISAVGARSAAHTGGAVNKEKLDRGDNDSKRSDDDDEEEQPQLGKIVALVVLAVSTALIAVTSDGMVSAIDSVTEPAGPLSEEFCGLILIPIVGNAAEHATAVTVAIKDKMDLAIGVAVGSSLQIALLVIPIMVLLNWFGLGSPSTLDLNFDGFQVVVLFIAIILVNYVIQDGRSHWLEGVMLMITYIIFAVAAWYYPASQAPN